MLTGHVLITIDCLNSFSCRSAKPHPSYYGGPLVDKAIAAVFAALIWHSQEIREDLISNGELSTPVHTAVCFLHIHVHVN